MPQRPQARRDFPPVEILAPLNGGLNGYNDPTQTKWNQWASAVNVFSGSFGFVQRARFANVINGTLLGTAQPVTSIANGLQPGTLQPTDLITTPTPHGFLVGQMVTIAGASPAIHNGTYSVILVNNTLNFTVAVNFQGQATSTVGTVAPGYVVQGNVFTTLRYYALPGLSSYLIADNNGKLFSFDAGALYLAYQRINPYIDPLGIGSTQLNGPWSRATLQNILYEMNGQVKQTGRTANAVVVEGWGLDTPDATLQIVISAGSSQAITNIQRTNGVVTVTLAGVLTVPGGNGVGIINTTITVGDSSFGGGQLAVPGSFVVITGSGTATLTWAQLGQNTALLTPTGTVDVNITKSIGRSYSWAWENANKPHVSAPSPSTQFILYNVQNGVIQLIQQGTITSPAGTPGTPTAIVGTGTAFTTAWIGRYLWAVGSFGGSMGRILTVTDATHLTVSGYYGGAGGTNVAFQVYDPQATHIRLYATADGQATYLRVQRNAFSPANNTLIGSGLQFFDNANAEPPGFPFTTELSQLNNVPPPVGSAVGTYQSALIVFGVPGALQSFFYSNQTLTNIGLPSESFAPLNQYTLPIQNAKLNGWIEMPGDAVFWSDRQDMFRLTGQLQDNTAAQTPTQLGATITRLPYNLGCVNPYAVDLTPLGAVWVTPQAEVWLFTDKYAPRNIGRPVQNVLNSIQSAQLPLIRVKYYHNNTRNWLLLACAPNGAATNNTLLILDLDLLASNGSPSFFVFDMATNSPAWFQYSLSCQSLEVMYEPTNLVRLLTGGVDLIQDADFSTGFGTEIAVPGANFLTHAWGNDSAPMIKRPTFMRFHTNRDPSALASDGWSFAALGIDDDFYTFAFPLSLVLTPGVNDTSTLGGNPLLPIGSPFRASPELFRIGGVNFVMGRRIQFQVNFPSAPGAQFQFRQVQLGFSPSPPR